VQNKYSDLKLLHFPGKLASFKSGVVTSPIYVRVKPINLCQHHCWWCVYHSPEMSQMHTEMATRDRIGLDKMREIIEDFAEMGVKAVTYSGGGEPLIHPDIVGILEHTLAYGIDLSIITNGSMLNGERAAMLANAKWVRVSMDYSCKEEMVAFRKVHEKLYDETMANIEAFSKLKSTSCDLYVNYIVHADNCQNLVYVAKTLKSIGVQNVRFSPMWLSPGFHEYHAKISPQVQGQLTEMRALIDDSFSVNTTYDLLSSAHNSFRTYKKCYVMQTIPVIGADLQVYACHNKAYDSTGAIGSIKDRSFKSLWFDDATKALFESFDAQAKCCHQCSNDNKNILINEFMNTSVDNFV
jgi:MoaA/NifB/PqqE/SkfB family radical SAM enzyme